jgi:hypothetical protein
MIGIGAGIMRRNNRVRGFGSWSWAIATCVLALSANVVQAQDPTGPAKIKTHTPVVKDLTPVTSSEAATVLRQAGQIMSKAFEQPVPSQLPIPDKAAPVTREQVVATLAEQFQALSPRFKFTPNPVNFDAKMLRIGSTQRSNLERLIRFGCVGKVAPLATGPKDTISVSEFGDALGFFMARIAQLTHLPDPKWSPTLENPKG